ncbi:MAG: DUF2892 domain-containing protein [Flavobacteriaceae bacterium]|uniref:Inner membrane protein YgaP-like transmembrane domain-containing protein n=1 Tax=Galbibacter orientalis DSM 19592 TaxID=926559 RepID=I3C1X0_9FLAO|nr:DUF2892 domain-containing protein [Galbibacter orientalis]EIJ37613.1 Protein of unknown function (DUF2892) [Galbibacter orientalis DSM 19592]
MKKNMGGADRIIRIIIAIVIGILYWQGIIEGTLAYVLIAVAAVFLLTSFVSFCPLYKLVGLNTCPRK